jgi:prepilin-type processing-associated H-X9-DG protein
VGINRDTANAWIWPALLRNYIGMGDNVELFKCPSAPLEAQWKVEFGSGLPASDGYLADEMRLRPGGTSFMSYGYNVWGGWAGQVPNTGLGVYKGDPVYGGAKEATVRVPTDMIAIGDSNWDLEKNGDRDWSGFIGMYAERQWPLEIHNNRANILFADGHVQALPRTEMIAQLVDGQAQRKSGSPAVGIRITSRTSQVINKGNFLNFEFILNCWAKIIKGQTFNNINII